MTRNPTIAEPPGLYAISVTSELSGFTAGTLRLYEQYGLITPTRTRGGTRRYNDDDLTRLGRIADLIADGINLVGIRRVLELEDSTAALRRDNARLRANNTELRTARRTHRAERATTMENDHIPAAVDATPESDYIEQTIPADPNAVDAVDSKTLTTKLDSTWPPPEGDLIEQSIPVPLHDDL
ncbi:MerR family transcriptional regulator [Rhodococcus erythropolis]|jgi:DNA-binding transcriptional MerR regulator|uniref:MerR family transcriptional regulator n=1 Tax=Rhodococcus erythropolis TaxID=1833 RepID=UPI0008C9CB9F|nr:MerR family transcriptional regulator [Rhodococcus erythropolis]OFV73781.1 putative heat shock protein HspR [Rhodococcus erythropolis]